MSIVSYSQNLEDVLLWRALKHIQPGFYIDVGANDPATDSVTRVFYEHGWHGINIEPLAQHHRDLAHDRPRDINLACAAGAVHGEIEIWECDVRGWATGAHEVVTQHIDAGHKGIFRKVPVVPLKDICTLYAKREIHFLKIDVEGMEKEVVEGMDLRQFRPWVFLIEATRPNSPEHVHHEWEGMLGDARYLFAYDDGVNRFYVAEEHADLLEAFRFPPNVFDEYVRADHLRALSRAQELEQALVEREADATAQAQRIQVAEARAQQAGERAFLETERAQIAEAKAERAEAQAQQLHQALNAAVSSRSWRIRFPLRWANLQIQRLRKEGFTARTKALIKKAAHPLIRQGIVFVDTRPVLRQRCIEWARRRGLYQTARTRYLWLTGQTPASPFASADEQGAKGGADCSLEELSPRAQSIYDELKVAIENNTSAR